MKCIEKQQLETLYGAEWRGDQTQAARERRARGLLNAAMAARPVLRSLEAELLSMLWPSATNQPNKQQTENHTHEKDHPNRTGRPRTQTGGGIPQSHQCAVMRNHAVGHD